MEAKDEGSSNKNNNKIFTCSHNPSLFNNNSSTNNFSIGHFGSKCAVTTRSTMDQNRMLDQTRGGSLLSDQRLLPQSKMFHTNRKLDQGRLLQTCNRTLVADSIELDQQNSGAGGSIVLEHTGSPLDLNANGGEMTSGPSSNSSPCSVSSIGALPGNVGNSSHFLPLSGGAPNSPNMVATGSPAMVPSPGLAMHHGKYWDLFQCLCFSRA